MLRSLLVGIEGSASSKSAVALAIRWAKRFDARVVGMGIIDDPGIQLSEEVLFAEAYHHPAGTAVLASARQMVASKLTQALEQFATACTDAGVPFLIEEESGSPHVMLGQESQAHDLVVLGQKSHFEYGHEGDPGQTLSQLLQRCGRPVVAVPEGHCGEGSVVIAYDGSAQAARSVLAFEASGLGQGRTVHVVTVNPNREVAARCAGRAVAYLETHDLDARAHAIDRSVPPSDAILHCLGRLEASLVVMGAFGQSAAREFFFGSFTRNMLKKCPVPVFLFH
jgi:nucleotide-binding universal stress UspA family protein